MYVPWCYKHGLVFVNLFYANLCVRAVCCTCHLRHVALQFPEGLLAYSTQISNLICTFVHCEVDGPPLEVTILGDVTYGACCIDDLICAALGVDLLVHYGHSCLVPLTETVIPVLYIFVDIYFDPSHLVKSLELNFSRQKVLLDGASDIDSNNITPATITTPATTTTTTTTN
eukprot:Lankesteria_metandrocarpae@DN3543_c0_g2_i2.p1